MNQKIQCLIDGGFISIQDVLEYAQAYMAMGQYNNDQIDKHGFDYDAAEERRLIDEMYTQEDMYSELAMDDDDYVMPESTRSSNPEYIIASTSYELEETYVFEANEDGVITNYGEYGGIAKRWGDKEWLDYYDAVNRTFGKNTYQFVRRINNLTKGTSHFLFKRLHGKLEYPLPSDEK